MNPIRLVTLAFQPDKKLALKKREMEKRLRAGGLSRSEALKAVVAYFHENPRR